MHMEIRNLDLEIWSIPTLTKKCEAIAGGYGDVGFRRQKGDSMEM